MKWTIGLVSCAVYAASLLALTVMAVLGSLDLALAEFESWVILAWLAGYATIVVMLVGGSAHWLLAKKLGLMTWIGDESHGC